jgi:alpha-glucosidase (family GH31 glycosyl hydrolase)
MPRLTNALALCLVAACARAEIPAAALSQVLIGNGDTQVVLAAGRLRIERPGELLAEVRSFEFNFAAPTSLTATAAEGDGPAVLHAVYPARANYKDETHDWPVDILVRRVAGGYRFSASPDWAKNATVRLGDLDDHFFGILERLYPNNLRSPDLRGQDVDVEAVGSAVQYGENWSSVFSSFYMTAHGYASFFDTFAAGRYRLGIGGETELYHHTGSLDWYVLMGSNGDKILSAYYKVIGAPKAVPLWSLGPTGWRDNDLGGAPNVVEDVRHLSELHIPFTSWWVDRPYSNGSEDWSKMDFSPIFANPAGWIGRLKDTYGLHVMTWVGPLMFKDRDFPGVFPDPPGYIDLSNPEAVREWNRRLSTFQYSVGIQGHKMDRADEWFPETEPWADGTDVYTRRNKYLFLYSKVVSDALTSAWGADQFNFARAAVQRCQPYLSAVWGGDVRSSWDGMGSNLANSLRVGFMGFPMWGSDVGGYLGGRIDEELYARWLEFGSWSGLFEIKLDDNDGRGPDRPPWVYSERLQAVFRDACERRMSLLPYLYSIARTSDRHGAMMKPLAYVWPRDAATYAIGDEYLFGPSFLVAPIIEAGGHRPVYLPAGTWYDYNDPGKGYPGGQTIQVAEPMEKIPVFIRGNSIYVTGTVPLGTGKAWKGAVEPGLAITATAGAVGDRNYFEFVDLFDHDAVKKIALERTPDSVSVSAPALGAPAEVLIRCDGVTLGTASLPAGQPILVRVGTPPHPG